MTRKETLDGLKKAQKDDDKERAHIVADDILCSFLKDEGFQDIVGEYRKVKKWYA